MDTSNRGINYAVVNELRQCSPGYKKKKRGGVIPSYSPIKRVAKQLEAAAAKFLVPLPDPGGSSWICEPTVAVGCFLYHFGYHTYGATARDPMLIAFTGDGLRVCGTTESCFAAGLKHVDRRLKSQRKNGKNWNQSKTEYFPLVVCLASEKSSIPHVKAIDKELLRIEKEGTIDAKAQRALKLSSTDSRRRTGAVAATGYSFIKRTG